MTTAEYNANNPLVVVAGKASGNKLDKISYVLCHQPKSFDWRMRDAKPHPLGQFHNPYFEQVRELLNQIIQLT